METCNENGTGQTLLRPERDLGSAKHLESTMQTDAGVSWRGRRRGAREALSATFETRLTIQICVITTGMFQMAVALQPQWIHVHDHSNPNNFNFNDSTELHTWALVSKGSEKSSELRSEFTRNPHRRFQTDKHRNHRWELCSRTTAD